jgi:hypothetical protein
LWSGGAYCIDELIGKPGAGEAKLEKVGRKGGSPFDGFAGIAVTKREKRKEAAGLRAMKCGGLSFAQSA